MKKQTCTTITQRTMVTPHIFEDNSKNETSEAVGVTFNNNC